MDAKRCWWCCVGAFPGSLGPRGGAEAQDWGCICGRNSPSSESATRAVYSYAGRGHLLVASCGRVLRCYVAITTPNLEWRARDISFKQTPL